MNCYVCEKLLNSRQKKYCSTKCSGINRTKKQSRACACGKEFFVHRYRIKDKSRGKYCSKECANKNKVIHPNSGQFKKGHIPWIKGKRGLFSGPNSFSWKGGLTSKICK